ncbi:MAG: branched-chain amino acid ABC transporter ATP-binding protein/permease [Sedimentitalea sp.]
MGYRSRKYLVSAAIVYALLCLAAAVAGLFLGVNETLIRLTLIKAAGAAALGLFAGTTGILSLGHVVFFGVGAYVATWFTLPTMLKGILLPSLPQWLLDSQWSLWLALVPAFLAASLVGAIFAPVMRRLRETPATIATFAMLVIGYLLFIGLRPLTNGKQSLYGIPRTELDWPLLLVVTAGIVGTAFLIRSGRVGRRGEAFREDELGARSLGIDVSSTLGWLWIASAGLMGVAGALFAHGIGVLAPDAFYLEAAFAYMVIIVLGGYRSMTGCTLGAVMVAVLEEAFKRIEVGLNEYTGTEVLGLFVMPAFFGFTALAFSLMVILTFYLRPDGVFGTREAADWRWVRRLAGPLLAPGQEAAEPDASANRHKVLETRALGKSYGAYRALSDVTLNVRAPEIVGLIGPNGAGKSTFINSVTGAIFATDGQIMLDDLDLTEMSMTGIATNGVGRSFQTARVFPGLSVLDNVVCAIAEHRKDWGQVQVEAAALGWLDRFNLRDVFDQPAGSLAYGDRRKLEIARALSMKPAFLLLDEPAAGMNHSETEQLTDLLKQIRDEIGCGILLVEHDLPMVLDLCDRIYVLNKGEIIADGTPDEITSNQDVITAYIGEDIDETT